MKHPLPFILLLGVLGLLGLGGCSTVAEPAVGMTEHRWLLNTIVNRIVYQQSGVTAYRSSGTYYYFLNGVLVKIDTKVIAASTILAEHGGGAAPAVTDTPAPTSTPEPASTAAPTAPAVVVSASAPTAPAVTTDIYTELRKLDGLRKDGIITEAEFEAQKKKLLDSK